MKEWFPRNVHGGDANLITPLCFDRIYDPLYLKLQHPLIYQILDAEPQNLAIFYCMSDFPKMVFACQILVIVLRLWSDAHPRTNKRDHLFLDQ